MSSRLQILHLEDEPDYLEVVRDFLAHEGISADLTLAATESQFKECLESRQYDLILADFKVPDYSALEALGYVKRLDIDIPFIVLSGSIQEQIAVETVRRGATDYVLKQLPEKLGPAVRRALQETAEKRSRQFAENELLRSNQCFQLFTENSLDIVCLVSESGVILYTSPSVSRVLGYEPAELDQKDPFVLVHPDDVARARADFRKAVENPHLVLRSEFRYQHKDGSWVDLEAVGRLYPADPSIRAVIMNLRDVTDRKNAERIISENEEQYRFLFESNPTPMFIFDHETLDFVEVNEAALRLYGYQRDEFLSLRVPDIRPADDLEPMIEYWHRLRSFAPSDICYAGIWKHRRKNGSLVDVEIRWSTIKFRGRAASLSMLNDVTERKRVEHRESALSKLGQFLSGAKTPAEAAEIIRSVADELFSWDAFVLDLYVPELDLIQPILNIDTDRLGRRFNVESQVPHAPSRMARRVIESGAQLFFRDSPGAAEECWRMGDLTRLSSTLLFVPIRNRTKVIGILSIQSYTPRAYDTRDLSTMQTLGDHCGGALERISAQQALHESEQRFRELFEGSPDAIFVEDVHGRVLDVNPAACQLQGYERRDLLGKHVSELVGGGMSDPVVTAFPDLVSGCLRHLESNSLRSDAQLIPVEIRANPIFFGGQPAVLLHVRDITGRRKAEEALRSSEMLFHSVWENSVDGMRLTDENGVIVAVNAAYCRLVGKSRKELEGQPFSSVYAESESRSMLIPDYKQRFADRVIERGSQRRLVLHNGAAFDLEFTSSFVELDHQSPLLLTLVRDVTAQKQLEDQLRQSQKMEAIGQLAGGVAHDFNNILTVIHGHASLLMSSDASGQITRSAQQIAQAAERAASLTRQLLAFGRRQVLQPKRLDLNEVVANMTRMLARLLGEDITLNLSYSAQPACVHADSGMIEQVLLNLVVNSRDAMPKGGALNIRIAPVQVTLSQAKQHADARVGNFVCLATQDTGCGIAKENLPHIFEPFFTTKEIGKGTGLGLATVYGIVKQHHGWIDVESDVNRGATFKVYLPACEPATAPEEERPELQIVRGGNETILVVEDETLVRELVCTVLSGQGYRVLQAESGVAALQIWDKAKSQIDLLLTDLVMPDRVNGRELAERLWAEKPDLKVIFTSGYSADVVGKDFVLGQGLSYLQKPYHPQKLALAVRNSLDSVN